MTEISTLDSTTRQAVDHLVSDAEASLTRWNAEYGRQLDTLVGRAANRAATRAANGQVQQHLREAAVGTRAGERSTERSAERADEGAGEFLTQHDIAAEIAEPTSSFLGFPYQWFDLIAVGPFQQITPGGPFAPSRVIRSGEPAVLLAAVWRNPFPLPFGPNPSAAQVMAGQTYIIRGQTIDVNSVSNGPDLGPVTNVFGAGFVNIHPLVIPSVPTPADGSPRLLEIFLTLDTQGADAGLPPFAGYASRWYQLDSEPPFLFPSIPGVGPVLVPGMSPGFVNESPARVLIYR
jgi:hypothetical protein